MSLDFPFAFNAIKLVALIARMGGFLFAFPLFTNDNFPVRHRLFLLLVIGVMLLPVTPSNWDAALAAKQLDFFGLALMMGMETLLGLMVAMVVMIFLEVFELVGYQCSDMMGFTMAEIVDPASGQSNSVMTILITQVFFIVFLICDFHLDLLRLAAMSFTTIGPGAFYLSPEMGGSVVSLLVEVYRMGFQLALPIFALNLIVNVCLALISKVGEEFPVLMLSFPVKIGLGLIVFLGMVPIFIYYSRVVGERIIEWIQLLIA